MIQGNYDNKTAYVHNTILWGKLFAAGWPVTKRDLTDADDKAVEVIKSTEEMGYWYYWCWAPTASGNKVLIKLLEFDLFPSAIEASIDQLQQEKRKALYKFAHCYHHSAKSKKPLFLGRRNPGKWWADLLKGFYLHNFLAKKDQAGAPSLPRATKEQGRGPSLPALPNCWRVL